ncbi:uncharacterized protein LOC128184774 [Crassostrea angulata]|uniref:uncharacterized protein LOC128184774 n=1 Tax=Magallana angulata TaxID=2784310 RepID=UPI0022B1B2DF|nr:uncharacterized protein LOC128184774 [Crassostrea angulata]
MANTIYYFLVLGLVQIQLITSQNRFCQEAVSSIQRVAACPTTKTEWKRAALKKNCSELALRQNCVPVNKFKYHCVINGLRNKLVEVCAPERIIFGHCVEFNYRGGVIQDQKSALCNRMFPKCDRYYYSTDAYKYPDCYMLVSKDEAIWLTTKDTSPKLTTMRTITVESLSSSTIIAIAVTLIVGFIAALVFFFWIIRKRRMRSGMRVDESKEAMLKDINIKHDNADDEEMVDKEDDEKMVDKEDDEKMVDKEDDEEMVEKEDELKILMDSSDLQRISYLIRRFSVNESSTCKTRELVNQGLRRYYSAGF